MRRVYQNVKHYLRFLAREYQRDRCAQAAAALAFGTLLSLVPLAALLGWLTRPFHRYISNPLDQVAPFFTPTPRLQEIISGSVERYTGNATQLGLIGLLFFLPVAWGMLASVESVINDIWHVQRRRGHFRRLAHFWAAVIFAPLLFFASATLRQAINRAIILEGLTDSRAVNWLLADALPFLLLVASATLAYWILPNKHVRFGSAVLGGAVTAMLYHLVRWGFGLYVSKIGAYDRIYGLLGVIPAFLIWLFLVWSVVLLGAEVAYSAQHPWDEEPPR